MIAPVLLPMALLLPKRFVGAVFGGFKDEHRATKVGNPRFHFAISEAA
jgi:hypothetical protein